MRTVILVIALGVLASAQVKKSNVDGITNFAQVETTVACTGAITPGSVAAIHNMGFTSVINLRQASEKGADIEAEAEAASAAGINFVHLPFDGSKPDPAVVDRFLEAIGKPENQPAFIHCASGNRAAAMWLVKRVLVDKWDTDKAVEEASQLGLTSQPLKTFALEYISAHQK